MERQWSGGVRPKAGRGRERSELKGARAQRAGRGRERSEPLRGTNRAARLRGMEFSEVLARRRMVRNYTDDPVDDAVLEEVARAALRAPSAGNSQALGVVLVTDEATRKAIADLAGEAEYVASGFDPWISKAPAHIVISVSEEVYHRRYQEPDKLGEDGEIAWPVPYWWIDAGAAMMAVLLSAVTGVWVRGSSAYMPCPTLPHSSVSRRTRSPSG